MIIEVENVGIHTGNACTASFQLPISTPHENVRVRLMDVSVPDPRFADAYEAALTTDVDTFDVPAVRNMFELVDYVDGLVDSGTGARLIEGYWDGASFELLALVKTVNLSAEFRANFKMPASLTVAGQGFAAATLNLKAMDVSDGYVVELRIGEAGGFYKEDHTSIVATFPRGSNKPSSDFVYVTREPARMGTIAIYSRRVVDGVLEEIRVQDEERWSARIMVDVPRSKINPGRF